VRSENVQKITIKTRYGHYDFLVMPFSLANTPSIFMDLMNQVFHDFLNRFVVVFIDDLLIYSANHQDHASHLRSVLEILREKKFYAKLKKC
jgi:hypothetical protein